MEPRSFDILLEEARRAIDQHSSQVARVRDRMANLVAVGGLAAAFIGGLAIRDDDEPLTGLTVLGAIAFAVLVYLAVLVLRPRAFVFTQHMQPLVAYAEKSNTTAERLARNLALRLDDNYRTNAKRLNLLTIYYSIGLLLLVLEVSFLLLDLRGS